MTEAVVYPGRAIVRLSWGATAVFALSATPAAVWTGPFAGPALAVALVLFGVGLAVFAWSYAAAVRRSRYDEISLPGLFLLSGSASGQVRRHLLASFAMQVVVALATAGARPFTSLAFGVLAPLSGLALVGLWGARHGTFPPRARQAAPARHRRTR
jgi:hypothetical protein